jgi:hypothetical protein
MDNTLQCHLPAYVGIYGGNSDGDATFWPDVVVDLVRWVQSSGNCVNDVFL